MRIRSQYADGMVCAASSWLKSWRTEHNNATAWWAYLKAKLGEE